MIANSSLVQAGKQCYTQKPRAKRRKYSEKERTQTANIPSKLFFVMQWCGYSVKDMSRKRWDGKIQ